MNETTVKCSTCGKQLVKVAGPSIRPGHQGIWVHADPADEKYCDEVAKPARVAAILDRLQAERMARLERGAGGRP